MRGYPNRKESVGKHLYVIISGEDLRGRLNTTIAIFQVTYTRKDFNSKRVHIVEKKIATFLYLSQTMGGWTYNTLTQMGSNIYIILYTCIFAEKKDNFFPSAAVSKLNVARSF